MTAAWERKIENNVEDKKVNERWERRTIRSCTWIQIQLEGTTNKKDGACECEYSPKRVMENDFNGRTKGKRRARWKNQVQGDLEGLRIAEWRGAAKNRKEWKR